MQAKSAQSRTTRGVAIRTVGAGQPYLTPALATRLAARTRQDPVTSGEVGVLRLVANGLRNRRIGERLQITESR
jgi:DNA-binding NarL/FixJ family response regulator